MRVSRQERGAQALMIIESDQPVSEEAIRLVNNIGAVKLALLIPPIA